MSIVNLAGLGIAFIGMPLTFIGCLSHCVKSEEPRSTIFGCFTISGLIGGWAFAFGMSPSGLTASSIVFLITIGTIGGICGLVSLGAQSDRSRLASLVFRGHIVYFLALALFFTLAVLIGSAE